MSDRFTVGVFQDVAWAQKGLDALKRAGFASDALTIISKESGDAGALIHRVLGAAGGRLDLATTGPIVARGPLVEALQGPSSDLAKLGIAGTMRRVGFQAHDGRIFEALVGRGGSFIRLPPPPPPPPGPGSLSQII